MVLDVLPAVNGGDSSAGRGRPVGSRFVGETGSKKPLRAATGRPPAVVADPAVPGLVVTQHDHPTRQPRQSRPTAFLPGLKAGTSRGGIR
jgi:hypothetical protein